MNALDRLRVDRGAAHLHALGPRPTAELLASLADRIGAQALLGLLAGYEKLTPATVRALGGDRFPPRPLHIVERKA